ncbi:RNA polymerase subunit sigma-70 [Enterococcus casseliflavus]|uniref:sigma factor-like helix-turn-helix DNA-binding protein n=1 Tax=Enterococcus casseliflavus TaxID=37734 RepID=UPI001C8C3135|nr:sigma factor-like helix-turn-helix DNA-binding protein [Enterococcus casseliflavus]MBX9115929.1 RNA polymerase subunit sigma-70 [Enterococcus casseliflavus]MBX9126341.1 RNA polymerase subunit sigma-70 [Enterococcus casseliflavus]
MIEAYKEDIKAIRKQIKMIQSKNAVAIDVQNQEKLVDMRTAQNKQDLTTLNEILSSTQYSLWWLKNGHEKPRSLQDIAKQNQKNRTQLWGDIDGAIQHHGVKSSRELDFLASLKEEEKHWEKQERLIQIKEILAILSPREKEFFLLKHEAILTEEECAEKMNVELGTVKSMAQRIRNKIEFYFENPCQTALFFDE